jgi:hypothetical protein
MTTYAYHKRPCPLNLSYPMARRHGTKSSILAILFMISLPRTSYLGGCAAGFDPNNVPLFADQAFSLAVWLDLAMLALILVWVVTFAWSALRRFVLHR